MSAFVAMKLNGNGGKRPPKDPPKEAPLNDFEAFSRHEVLAMILPEFAPSNIEDLLTPPSARGIHPAAAQGVLIAYHADLIDRDTYCDDVAPIMRALQFMAARAEKEGPL
ncbi:MAG: hypothetical protein ACRCWJ_03465 [Casimicrobium sp.]